MSNYQYLITKNKQTSAQQTFNAQFTFHTQQVFQNAFSTFIVFSQILKLTQVGCFDATN